MSFPVFVFFLSLSSYSQTYTPISSGSLVKFTINNFGLNTNGIFSGLKGEIKYNANNLQEAYFNVSVDANTINTGISAKDNHLKKEEYFDIIKYPTMHFVSTKITSGNNGNMILNGTLTIKGISKEVAFPFIVSKRGNDLLFTGAFKINREDFKVGGSSMVLSNNVSINLQILSKKNP